MYERYSSIHLGKCCESYDLYGQMEVSGID